MKGKKANINTCIHKCDYEIQRNYNNKTNIISTNHLYVHLYMKLKKTVSPQTYSVILQIGEYELMTL